MAYKIIIDPGHGGSDFGATYKGRTEKEDNLNLALAVGQILENNGLQWGKDSMSGAIVEDLDARCICALLVGAVRAERFCDGALMSFFKNGSIARWLQRLKDIDEGK